MKDAYTIWNENLAAYFFNENMAGREVLLYANFDLIEEIGHKIGKKKEDFINAVKTGPSWMKNEDLCVKAYKSFQRWQFNRSDDYPPYIAYLASFVLANYIEGEFEANAYYPRLKTLLSLELESEVHHYFHKMLDLWDDLEKWSKEDREGELGNFTARIRGKKLHIGLPLSQAVLSKEERNHLPLLFGDASFEPGANPSSAAVLIALKRFGTKYLDRKTLRLVNSNQEEDLKNALVNFVQEELVAWSGISPATPEGKLVTSPEDSGHTRSAVKICLRIESLSKKVAAFLRIKSNSDFPVDGLNMSGAGNSQQELNCKRSIKLWTTPLNQDQQQADACLLDWTTPLILNDEERKWMARLPGENIKWFVPGKHEQLPDSWVESSRVPENNVEFAVACSPEQLQNIADWVKTQCELLKPEMVLLNGWTLFQIKTARISYPGTGKNDVEQVILRLRGGVRLGNKNSFVNYCPPKVIVENAPPGIEIKISGDGLQTPVKLHKEEGLNIWSFPPGLPAGQPLKIQVLKDEKELEVNGNRVISFDDGSKLSTWNSSSQPATGHNAAGKLVTPITTISPVVNGAKLYNYDSIQFVPEVFPSIISTSNLIFLGQRIGEVQEVEPDDQIQFDPVWVLAKKDRKRWLVNFCASDLDKALPLPAPVGTPGRYVKEWKRFVWTNRLVNDTSQLEPAVIKELWEAYKNAAARL